jgi:hypothetical protein
VEGSALELLPIAHDELRQKSREDLPRFAPVISPSPMAAASNGFADDLRADAEEDRNSQTIGGLIETSGSERGKIAEKPRPRRAHGTQNCADGDANDQCGQRQATVHRAPAATAMTISRVVIDPSPRAGKRCARSLLGERITSALRPSSIILPPP